jgi:excinuclease ABC subunit C
MNVPRFSNFDVFGYATNNMDSAVTVLIVRAGKTIACEPFAVRDATFNPAECLSAFFSQYYDLGRGVPDEIITGYDMPDAETIGQYLYGKYKKRPKITAPKKGTKRQLAETARINAEDFLEKAKTAIDRRRDMTEGAVSQLRDYLALPAAPERIECYDISNISGTDKVASMVVFSGGEADKSRYRRFKIKTVEGADDYASMAEVLKRRMARMRDGDERFDCPPDLIVIDGGKGQLSAAAAAVRAEGFEFPMIGLAEKEEDVYVLGKSEPVFVPKTSFALKLLQRVRDEAHRFALAYHRNLRSNRYTSSLEEISGVGKQRRIKLLAHFRSIDAIKNASVSELQAVGGVSEKLAEVIFRHFRPEERSDSGSEILDGDNESAEKTRRALT